MACQLSPIGKDILTTHAVYWATMLLAIGLPLPKPYCSHGWWLSGESKMSKSLGKYTESVNLLDNRKGFVISINEEMVL